MDLPPKQMGAAAAAASLPAVVDWSSGTAALVKEIFGLFAKGDGRMQRVEYAKFCSATEDGAGCNEKRWVVHKASMRAALSNLHGPGATPTRVDDNDGLTLSDFSMLFFTPTLKKHWGKAEEDLVLAKAAMDTVDDVFGSVEEGHWGSGTGGKEMSPPNVGGQADLLSVQSPQQQQEAQDLPRPKRRKVGDNPAVSTDIGTIRLGDKIFVRWIGDGLMYQAAVVNVSRTRGLTVRYPADADWDSWTEVIALEELIPERSCWQLNADDRTLIEKAKTHQKLQVVDSTSSIDSSNGINPGTDGSTMTAAGEGTGSTKESIAHNTNEPPMQQQRTLGSSTLGSSSHADEFWLETLQNFARSADQRSKTELQFPTALSTRTRAVMHKATHAHGLSSESIGEGTTRSLVVKRPVPVIQSQIVRAPPAPTVIMHHTTAGGPPVEVFVIYIGNIQNIDDSLLHQLLSLCGSNYSPCIDWSRKASNFGICKYGGAAGAACAMRTLTKLSIPMTESAESADSPGRALVTIQMKVGKSQGTRLKRYETMLWRSVDTAAVSQGVTEQRTRFGRARVDAERCISDFNRNQAAPQVELTDAIAGRETDGGSAGSNAAQVQPPVTEEHHTSTPEIAAGATQDADAALAKVLQAEEDSEYAREMAVVRQQEAIEAAQDRQLRSAGPVSSGDHEPRSPSAQLQVDASQSGSPRDDGLGAGVAAKQRWTEEELESLWVIIEMGGPGDWETKAEMLGTGRTGRAVMSKFYGRAKSSRPGTDLQPIRQAHGSSTRYRRRPGGASGADGDDRNEDADTQTLQPAVQLDRNGCGGATTVAPAEADPGATICSICMSPAEDSVETPCGHTFCTDCISYWLNQKESGTTKCCPTCRKGLRQFARKLTAAGAGDELPTAWREEEMELMSVGQRVEADFGEYSTMYPGVISAVNNDGTLAVQYDDGDFEASVKRSCVRSCADQDAA